MAVALLCQYIVPVIVVVSAYSMVSRAFHASSRRLKESEISMSVTRKMMRRRKTDIRLILTATTFFLSWLPINLFIMMMNVLDSMKVIADHTPLIIGAVEFI